ncbi:MAG: FAD binding domain-containing protein, partial [Actinobacteria bacterium]|nr:FAD binding domain-containing protein [Actinomycetota bacterium]
MLIPENLAELREAACSHDPVLLAGGTDLMVALNHRSQRIESDSTVVSLAQVSELRTWSHDSTSGELTIGSGITWSQLERTPFDTLAPALAQA